jgi:DNA polymerase-3 subunit gamma/tau
MRVLSRAWQMLLKGLEEVAAAGRPLAAAEMIIVRIAYAADLPTPDEAIRSLGDAARGNGAGVATAPSLSGSSPAAPRAEAPRSAGTTRAALTSAATLSAAAAVPAASQPAARSETTSAPPRALRSFEELIALTGEKRDLSLKSALERDVRLVRFEDGRIEIGLEPTAPKTLTGDLSKKLSDWTGRRWMVIVSADPGAPTLHAQAQSRKAELKDGVRADPLVQAVLTRFPGAEIVDVRPPAGEPSALDEPPFDAPGEPGRADDDP